MQIIVLSFENMTYKIQLFWNSASYFTMQLRAVMVILFAC